MINTSNKGHPFLKTSKKTRKLKGTVEEVMKNSTLKEFFCP